MDILRCLLLPIYDKTLIVPYSAVAEIVTLPNSSAFSKSKNWILGEYDWRGKMIPLVCLEMQESKTVKLKPNLYVAVLNRMTDSKGPDFIGILLQSVPVMHRYKKADINFVSQIANSYLQMEVLVKEKTNAFIPNIPWIEEKLAGFKGLSQAS